MLDYHGVYDELAVINHIAIPTTSCMHSSNLRSSTDYQHKCDETIVILLMTWVMLCMLGIVWLVQGFIVSTGPAAASQ